MASRPLHEASTADEALALARAEYGPQTDLLVRETRRGGIGGFFATRRFVAEPAAVTDIDAVEVSAGAGTVRRSHGTDRYTDRYAEHDAAFEAAIAEAADTLGSSPMTTPTRPLTGVSADCDPHANSQTSSGALAHSERRTSAPTSLIVSRDSDAAASPFAAALSRMSTEPEVTSAVMEVMDGTNGGSGRASATVLAAPSRVVLYSVPHTTTEADGADGSPDNDAQDGQAGPGDVLADTEVAASLGDYNYAAMLVGGRGAFPAAPSGPAPKAATSVAGTATTAATAATTAATAATTAATAATAATTATTATTAAVTETGPATAGDAPALATALAAAIPHAADPTGLLPRLAATGFPAHLVPDLFLHEVGEKGIHTALTRLIKMRTSPVPALPVAPCTVVLVGPGTEALTAAMNACGALRADAAQVAWVGPAHLSNMVPANRRISTPQAATTWLAAPKRATVVNVIAVHAPMSETIDPHTRAVIAALNPTMVLAVADAAFKVEAVTRWVDALDCVDALALENASNTHDPAAWLTFAGAPVALVEGRKATAARWASLLCERLTDLSDDTATTEV